MVSQLNARLLNGLASNSIAWERGSNLGKAKAGSENPESEGSGYSADGSAAVNPPVFIDLLDASRRGAVEGSKCANKNSGNHDRNKRRRIAELTFTASNAISDIKEGGLQIPEIKLEKTRELDGCKIDMSKIKLKSSKTVGETPFLSHRKLVDTISHSISEYQSLFAATYQTYEEPEIFEWDSSTSSVTSSESDRIDSETPSLVIHPLLEDGLKASAAQKAKEEAKSNRTSSKRRRPADLRKGAVHPLEKLPYITMSDALAASEEARYGCIAYPFHIPPCLIVMSDLSSFLVLL